MCVAAVGLNQCGFPGSARHIDGQDYMWAVSEILDSAKDAIFILVGVLLATNNSLAEGHGRIGGSLQSCTFGMRA